MFPMIHAAPRKVKWGMEKSRREILKGGTAAAMPPKIERRGVPSRNAP